MIIYCTPRNFRHEVILRTIRVQEEESYFFNVNSIRIYYNAFECGADKIVLNNCIQTESLFQIIDYFGFDTESGERTSNIFEQIRLVVFYSVDNEMKIVEYIVEPIDIDAKLRTIQFKQL
ncbi:hypothetical protein [Brevibacillus brevis]|uniref:hypothetical protein n=1 Tax=Brevibacillus brevis TaxID=1393 RepID=UPI000D0E4250|nr:hypothetical protein [Brevibacillus brevis]PSJ67463.1 hypothetical protein C7J99_20950 [Brevibacillus brevis]RED28450.1 hypothetical protein DES34_108317 [Brevibacillus brevis]GEC90705.1 hypothetical protein BBR01nite_30360 [Brevibacillus brevis]VEF91145.1 Uncharacterised protein [Brevibacillus brevis]